MSHVARGSFRQNEAKRVNRAAAVRVTRAIQPQQREGEAAFCGIRGFSVGNGKDSETRRPAAEKAADVAARDGMFKIGRSGQRLDRFVGKLFRQDMAKTIAKCFAGKVALSALKFQTNKFEAVGLGASESLDSKREPLVRMIGDGENAPRQIVIFRPEMQERLLRGAANFPR